MNLSTRQLLAFLALVQAGSFTRAAVTVHLSQPAFSALIRALEEAVGARLFDRDTRKVELTAEGRVFEVSARRILSEFEGALRDVRDHTERRRGRASLALLPSLAAGWLPPVAAEFRATYPGIQLEVADLLSEACIERVLSGRADFAIVALSVDTPVLRVEPFCCDRFQLVCRHDNPLATTSNIRAKDLVAQPFIHQVRNSIMRRYLDAALHPLRMNVVMEVEQLATVMGMVRAGIGVSAVPALNLAYFQYPGIVTRELALRGLVREISVIRRRDRQLSLAAQTLYELLLARKPLMVAVAALQPL